MASMRTFHTYLLCNFDFYWGKFLRVSWGFVFGDNKNKTKDYRLAKTCVIDKKMTWCKNTVLYIHRVATVKILDCCHSVFVLLCSLPCNAEENGWDEAIRQDLIVCQSNQKHTHTALFAFYILFASFCIDSSQF